MHEECGIFALYGNGLVESPAEYAYLALYAMQHRGQQSCGIAVSNSGVIECSKGMGLVADVFDEEKLEKLKGENVIAHALYSTAKASTLKFFRSASAVCDSPKKAVKSNAKPQRQ